jgi:hypothetical protein
MATPEQWARCESDARTWSGAFNCIPELRASAEAKPAPAGSLVERLRDAVYKQSGRDPTSGEMCAAIREVAAWLEEQESDLYQLGDALNILEQESNRG